MTAISNRQDWRETSEWIASVGEENAPMRNCFHLATVAVPELLERIAKLEERLEIDHAFQSTNEHPEPQRYEIPPEERDNFPDGIECRDETIKLLEENCTTLRAVRQQLEEENDRLEDALQQIDSWSRAYPLDIFPEPDFDKAREVLTAAGLTLDAIASSCMRRVVDGVGRIARAALSPNQERLRAQLESISTKEK